MCCRVNGACSTLGASADRFRITSPAMIIKLAFTSRHQGTGAKRGRAFRHAALAAVLAIDVLSSSPACCSALATDTPGSTLRTDAPKDFLPEGLAWDRLHRRFLISSIRMHRVDTVDPRTGHAQVFADAPGSVLGLQVSADGKTLWAAWTSFAGQFKHNKGTGIIAWSLADGHRIGVWPLIDHDARANLGDLLIVDDHSIVTTDSGTGAVYRFDMQHHAYQSLIAAGSFISPQGIAKSRAPGNVYVADYSSGLWRVNLADGARDHLVAPKGIELSGLDGLYRAGRGLIAVQNGTRIPRILWIALGDNDAVDHVNKLAEGRATWNELALGTIVGARFWFNAASPWSRFDKNLRPLPKVPLPSPLLDSVALPTDALDHD
jgi:sugar lactone lactonase YvrE